MPSCSNAFVLFLLPPRTQSTSLYERNEYSLSLGIKGGNAERQRILRLDSEEAINSRSERTDTGSFSQELRLVHSALVSFLEAVRHVARVMRKFAPNTGDQKLEEGKEELRRGC